MARYRFDDIEVDPHSFRLLKAGRPVAVEPKALNLLIFLVENRGRLVGRHELIDAVWNGAFVTDHVLNRAIGQLRKLLGDDAKEPRFIETVPTLGYRFIADVAAETPEVGPSPSKLDRDPHRAQPLNPPVNANGLTVSASISPKLPDQRVAEEIVPMPASRARRRAACALGVAVLLAATVAAVWVAARRPHVAGPVPIRSLVVLPLENLSGDAAQDYLADGMTDELITSLGQISALRVISHTTTMQYKNAHKPLPQIAQELNVDAVVEGSVQRSGDRIRIAAQLVEAPTDRQLWANSYEGELRDVMGLQNQAATAVAEQIRIKLTSKEQTRLADKREIDPRAYEAFLKGDFFFKENTPKTAQKSLEYFQEATKLDPKFARAYVGIGRSYNFLGEGIVPAGEATAASDAAVAKALQLDPGLGEAYAERAWTLLFYHWDFPGTERDFRYALELEPNTADAHEGYGVYLVAMGRFDEGLRELKRARDLDPLSPIVITDYCHMLLYARRYDDALAECSDALELDPNYQWALSGTAEVYYFKGQYAEAHKMLARLGKSDAAFLAMRDEAHGAPGVAGAFDSWLKTQKAPPDAFFLALGYAVLGRKDQAFAALEKAHEERSNLHGIIFTGVDPHFDSLRSDPRFDAFLRHAGLPPQPPTGSAQPDRSSRK